MQNTPPNLPEYIIKWLTNNSPLIFSVGAALSTSALMSLYDGKSILKAITGSIACGIVAITVADSLEYLNIPTDAITFVGAAIGFMGAEKVREKIICIIDKRFRGKKDENEQ